MLGLIIGKPAGIFLFSWLSIKLKLGKWPEQCSPLHVLGAGMLGGIGFTMSIFVTLLSVKSVYDIQVAKLAILIASLVSALGGLIFLALLKAPKIRRGE
jgi:NhaA family Na+:H+ antiporter